MPDVSPEPFSILQCGKFPFPQTLVNDPETYQGILVFWHFKNKNKNVNTLHPPPLYLQQIEYKYTKLIHTKKVSIYEHPNVPLQSFFQNIN
jgi:hypothetical protein